ncbi:MAG: hypothetical protein AVDCRST_MAG26-2622 [uncultured Chloroflexia bacterium]|uniref:Aspartate racemase n=1 Tax=uncultured Chloroflexia bacterium TaxID=1672391 RepID=A0A6J4J1S9_9CHLR|nr:MAG: hypothetical protein AVDCRST_MAG26-2622 [uncultured Chloroflexia bacterium]
MKTIGVLGGLGPQATMDFEARVHRVAQELVPQHGNVAYPPMVVYYFREPPVDIAGLPTFSPTDPAFRGPPPPANPRMLDAARGLGTMADFLVLPSNGVHTWQREIEQAAGRPVLSMVDATMAEIQRRGPRKVGIVDFRPQYMGVYPRPLDHAGIAWEALPDHRLDAMYAAVVAVDEGRAGAEEARLVQDGVAYLRSRQADAILLACTEIPLMLPDGGAAPDLINPVEFLADAAVRFALT